MSTLTDLAGLFGLTGDIAIAFAAAEFDPTSRNVIPGQVRGGLGEGVPKGCQMSFVLTI